MRSPARKVTNTGTKKNIGRFFSQKMQMAIVYESLLERDYMYFLEIDPLVKCYSSQPMSICYTMENSSRQYTPDLLVERISKTQILEVKPKDKLELPENIQRFEHISKYFHSQGLEFAVVTDEMIRVKPLLSNIKLLYRYANSTVNYQQYLNCQQYFKHQKAVEFKVASQDLIPHLISKQTLYKLLFVGFLETDLMQPLNDCSYLRLSESGIAFI